MNIDTLSPQLPPVATPDRSVHTPADQATNRPVERPHHAEPPDNRKRNESPEEPRQPPEEHNRAAQDAGNDQAARTTPSTAHSTLAGPAPVGTLLDVIV